MLIHPIPLLPRERERESVTKTISSFTLIELLIVVAIIGILAALIIVSVTTAASHARDARRLSDVRTLENALAQYYIDNGSYPAVAFNTCQTNNVTNSLQVLVTDGLLQSLPQQPLPQWSSGDYCGDLNYTYGSPDWWSGQGGVYANAKYRIEFSLESQLGNTQGFNISSSWFPTPNGRWGYSVDPS